MQNRGIDHILHWTVVLRTVRNFYLDGSVFHRNGRESEIASVLAGMIYECRASTSYSPAIGFLYRIVVHVVLMGDSMKLCKRASQIFGVHLLVGWALVSDGPVMGRGWWWRNEKLLLKLWRFQVLGCGRDVGGGAKVYSHLAVHDDFAVEGLFYKCGGWDVVKGGDDATEGF